MSRAFRPTASPAALLAALAVLGGPPRGAAAQIPQTEYAARRAALAARVADGVLLALGAPEPAEDYLSFHQSPSFRYLTGLREPGAALVLVRRGTTVAWTLFVEPNDPAREVWTGTRLGPAGAARTTGLATRPIAALRPTLDSLLRGPTPTLAVVGDVGRDTSVLSADDQRVRALSAAHPALKVSNGNLLLEQLRGTKSAAELDLIRKAVDITVLAQREAIRAVRPDRNEFEIQALIEYTFRRNGAERPSFASIVGSGPNATTLHYNADDRFIRPGDLVVMDVGASYRGYAADVTRTVPASGTFTPEQRAIYDLVRDAQAAAERQATLNAPARRMSDSATTVLAAGLARLGLIESPTALYDCNEAGLRQCPQYLLYYMHGLGHGIGLEVHDPDQFYFSGRVAPGSAFTIEPGLYVRANLLSAVPDTPRNRAMIARIRAAVERYRDIGVRIEDDYVATAHGVEWISRAPREAAEIEQLMHEGARDPTARDSAKVDWYRTTADCRAAETRCP